MHLTTLLKDLCLLASVFVAHFIVWRALRRCRKEDMSSRSLGVDFKAFND
jgi:hypothetical protein